MPTRRKLLHRTCDTFSFNLQEFLHRFCVARISISLFRGFFSELHSPAKKQQRAQAQLI